MAKRRRVSRELHYHHPDDLPYLYWDRPPDEGDDDGGAHVREPRRPLPHGPGAAAEITEAE